MLDQNGDLHFSAGLDFKVTGRVGFRDLNGNVGAGFADKPLFDLARGEQFAFASSQRAVVDADAHRDGGWVDVDEGKGVPRVRIGDGFSDEHVLEPANPYNVPSRRLLQLDFG